MLSYFLSVIFDIKFINLLIITLIVLIIYNTVIRTWSYFSDRNLKFIRGWPILGTQYKLIFGNEPVVTTLEDMYYKYPKEKIIGVYEMGGLPTYFIRDPDIIKQISIKDFDHFVNHRFFIDETVDPMMGKTLFFMRNPKWKDMRTTLSPAFTGSKMRLMFSIMNEFTTLFIKTLKESKNNKSFDCELKDLLSRYASDIIATCAFGLEVNSVKERENDFFKFASAVTNFDGFAGLKFFGWMSWPKLMKYLDVKIVQKTHANYFRNLVLGAMRYREDHKIVRHDMINLLMQAKKGELKNTDDDDKQKQQDKPVTGAQELKKWEDDDLVAQCVIFLLAGFETTSTLLCFMGHELAVNPDVQEKLYNEIIDTKEELDGKPLTYEALNKMKYMDMVISESLRKWNPTILTDRLVTKPIVLNISDRQSITLNAGDNITIPTYSLQLDPKYFPNPETFDPERFNDENVKNVKAGTYMPFGMGPRICIGSRFALMECKSIFYYILLNFELSSNNNTQIPLKLKPNSFNMTAEQGFFVQFTPRN